jgi:hypothetical protein
MSGVCEEWSPDMRTPLLPPCVSLQRASPPKPDALSPPTALNCVTRDPEPYDVRPLGGTRHVTAGCDGAARAQAVMLW